MRVLFVSNTSRHDRPYLDPAVRYRCFNPARDLRKMGHIADVLSFARFNIDMIGNYDAFVFHKPPFNRTMEAAVALIEKRGQLCIADYDDLTFDTKNALSSSLLLTGRASEKIVLDIYSRNLDALKCFKNVTVSTDGLKKEVEFSHPESSVEVIYNGLNRAWVDASSYNYRGSPVPGLISYFSGTKSHDADFPIVAEVLSDLMRDFPQSRLCIVGPLEFDETMFPANRLQRVKHVPYDELPNLIVKTWVSIAPLPDTLFNRCKSGLKYFEAGVFGVPSVVSPIPDMLRFKDSAIVLAETSEQWSEGLRRLMDTNERTKASQIDKAFVRQKCMSETQTQKLANLLESGFKTSSSNVIRRVA